MDWSLLVELSNAVGLPGGEGAVREIVREKLKELTDEISTDAMGNIIAHVPGSGPKLMLDAHMDEVGFMVSHIDDEGFVYVVPLGSVDPRVFYAQRVVVWGRRRLWGVVGSVPPHLTRDDPKAREKVPSIEDCFIDLGLEPKKVHELVQVGDLVSFDRECVETEDAFIGKAFDDRVGLFVMLEGARAAKRLGCDLYLAGIVQEEGGLRGAGPAAFSVQPELAVSVEGTLANDVPGAPEQKRLARQGMGPEIRLSDRCSITDREWSFFVRDLARRRGIPHQVVVKRFGATNAAVVQTTARGAKATVLSLPVRYIHSPQGIVRKSDIEAAVRLVAAIIEEAENFQPSSGGSGL